MGLIRFLLAVSVIVAHSTPIFGIKLVGGQTAVQAFFILSGFYMALVLNEKYIGQNNSYKLFITNRLLRIYPVYWIILILTILLFLIFLIFNKDGNNSILYNYINYNHKLSLSSFLFLLFSNIFILFQDFIMFLGVNIEGNLIFTSDYNKTNPMLWTFLFVPQAWSVSLEIIFYFIAPFLLRRNLIFISVLTLLTFIVRYIFYQSGYNHDPWTYRFFPFELGYFLLGAIAYHLYIRINDRKIDQKILVAFFSVIILWTLISPKLDNGSNNPYLLMFSISLPFIFILTKKSQIDSYLGNLSYPMYVSHVFIFYVVRIINIPYVKNSGIKLSFLTIVFSILLNKLISEKIEMIRQRRLKLKV